MADNNGGTPADSQAELAQIKAAAEENSAAAIAAWQAKANAASLAERTKGAASVKGKPLAYKVTPFRGKKG